MFLRYGSAKTEMKNNKGLEMLFCGVPLYVQADLMVFFYFGKETTRSRSEYSFEAVAVAGYSSMGFT